MPAKVAAASTPFTRAAKGVELMACSIVKIERKMTPKSQFHLRPNLPRREREKV
jgi:hypothetical protein